MLLFHVTFRNKTKTLLYPVILYRGSQYHCAADQQSGCTVLTVDKSHIQNAVDACMTADTKSQHLQSLYNQPGVLYTLLLTHSNPNPTADS